MSLEPCPFCGKPFKRLKAHLPYCKMSPASKISKNSNTHEEIPTNATKHTANTDKCEVSNKKRNHRSFQDNLKPPTKPKSQMKPKMTTDNDHKHRASINFPDTGHEIQSAQGMNTDAVRPKSKWLAKREKEMIKQVAILKQKGSKFNSDSQDKEYYSIYETSRSVETPHTERNLVKGLQGGTTNSVNNSESYILQGAELTAGFHAEQCIQKNETSANVIKQTQSISEPLSKEFLGGVNHKAHFSLFQNKTSVWDHIKDGLYVRRSGGRSMPVKSHLTPMCFPKTEDTFATVTRWPQTNILKTPLPSVHPICQTSVQGPFEDTLKSTLQSKNIKAWTSETASSYGGVHESFPSGVISIENVLYEKCQYSNTSPRYQGLETVQRLGDVQLCNLATWLSAQTPKTPLEVVTMLNKGWQWYYRKYIDVGKGGIGGITMLIAGYCVLSYIWSYPHLKKQRWRKYH